MPNPVITLLIALSLMPFHAAAQNLLANPGFEEWDEETGLPTAWKTDKDGAGAQSEIASDGLHSAAMTSGYGVLQQDLQIPDLAGKNLRIRLDVRSDDGAMAGVYVGHMHEADDGKLTWRNHALMWDRKLTADYSTQRLLYRVPEDAHGPRVWICIYRSNRAGTLFVDNTAAALNTLSAEDQTAMNRLERDWRYMRGRISRALAIMPDSAPLKDAAAEAEQTEARCFAGDPALLRDADASRQRIAQLCALVNRTLKPDASLAAGFSRPYQQLAPDAILPPAEPSPAEILALPGEHHAIGVTLASASDQPVSCRISHDGLPADSVAVQVRRQGFMETWYRKEHELLADPLGLLTQADGAWTTTLAPGEIARLCIQLHCTRGPVEADAAITIAPADSPPLRLPIQLTVLESPPPPADSVGHISFMYPTSSVAAHSPEEAAADMGAHGVTMMEFPYPPPCEFSPEGELLTIDLSTQERWIKTYSPHIKQMMIFYAPAYDKFSCGEDQFLVPFTEAWNRGFTELLTALLKRGEELGYGIDCFSILPYDEPYSETLGASPDAKIADVIKVMKLCRERFPELTQVVTLCNYTFPADVAAMAPYMDIAIPHWPLPEMLAAKYAPAAYNPRAAFESVVAPTLEARRETDGMRIWSYHVAGGKSDDVLIYNRAYPIRAIAAGQTGVATWAYNVSRGNSWDDTDGGGLDYVYVYDGRQDHETNRRLNPTGEAVVTSVRWEALRAGIQDARLLLRLREMLAAGEVPDAHKPDAESILVAADSMAADDSFITWQLVDEVSNNLRRVWPSL